MAKLQAPVAYLRFHNHFAYVRQSGRLYPEIAFLSK